MSELRIEYATSLDGVRLATAAFGSGPAIVCMPNIPWSHIRLEWLLLPEARKWYESLAARRKVILYDPRGGGLSDRDVTDFGLTAQVNDLKAVLDHWHVDECALLGIADSGPASILYACQNPKAVTHLVLWCSYANVERQIVEAEVKAAMAVLEGTEDWDYFAKLAAHVGLGYPGGNLVDRFTEWARNATTRQALLAAWREQLNYDVTDLLAAISAPTLVVHRAGVESMSLSVAQDLTAAIPGAKLSVLDGKAWLPWAEDTKLACLTIYSFLGEAPAGDSRVLQTVLFTDLVGHTEMMHRLGDERGREVLREYERATREILKANGGTEVKTMGDGFMASFASVTRAVECAVALQNSQAERADEALSVRIGLNAGEPIEEDGDLFGSTVILASRIAAKAEGGEILVASAVRELCAGKGFLFADRGEFVAKGFEEPVRVYEVRWRE